MKKVLYIIYIFSLCISWSSLPAREYHVSVQGNDNNSGTLKAPFKTIDKAARVAYPGDVITVHEGTYRERIDPLRGGEKNKPIIYQAAKGEKVEIKGSEVIKGWEKQDDRTWFVSLPNTYWGDFNPYADTIYGDWLEKGKWCHTGEVYLNNEALSETPELDRLLAGKSDTAFWYCRVNEDTTTIWANFDCDPNKETVEINVRQSVFYPSKPYVNYIHVRGFVMSHAATPWAPPTAEQIGLIGTHWSKGWVIEDNKVSHSKCVGITLGKYGDEWDNKSESAEAFVRTTERALENNWDRDHIGSHIIRNNQISYCGQAGIAGSLGAIFSLVEGNSIFEIGMHQSFWGYELAGIKFHAAVDAVISNNHIYRTEGGIWLDWMTQGTRITRNFLHDNKVQDFSLEVNHGPVLVDNNFFLSRELSQVKLSQGIAFVNNLIAWKIWETPLVDERETPYLAPHGTSIEGLHNCPCGDVTYYNNIFTRIDMTPYDACSLPVRMGGNIFLSEAIPSEKEEFPHMNSGFDPDIRVIEKTDGWYLQMKVLEEWRKESKKSVLSTKDLPAAVIPHQSFNREDGTPIVFDLDYLENKRQEEAYPGPVNFTADGVCIIKIFPKK
ncbi:right-handed parallel beta-helix repeat-containing protein [uncultured Parabacteroides sp.]|jgi:hypothetical protein|uniref:right-handed parallel beta-helix repeat-containing protein n=1 Tax=uncultured Parabacteroides sp. TaxID=512312 RepID=UPI0025E1DE81|nr:right-handed parallel beta-helix repeat-containing protein [uncultured Parabacteroides sp.]